ncbi:6294_t:CDS:10 [Diversispora eburnea]|uniref:6294_t:CDS:1 n=1 Tax=Diversispora eburnea TaxID=1213867 RepID=A0A9N8UVU8_9GLOM|nr:6294_t:CDS:10 [Diversispora eburnea]
MVHESLRLYAANDSYTLVPYYLDPTIPAQTLVINRENGFFELGGASPEPTLPPYHSEPLTIYGVFGVIKLLSERIGRLGRHDIFQADQFRILPFAKNILHLSKQQAKSLLTSGTYYFSYTYDLTHTLQRQAQLGDSSKPLWQRADDRFFWNRYVQSKLIDITINNPDQDLSDFILPVVFGFTSISLTKINNRDITFCLISRRSRYRVEGNVSNFNETEQIILLDPPKDSHHINTSFEGKIKLSYVQTRGSIPVYWSQINDIKYTPKIQLMDYPNLNATVRRHFDEQIKSYGKQILVNLINKKGFEYPVGAAYEKIVKQLNDPRIVYFHFDFHHECRKMRWDRIQILLDLIEEELIQQGFQESVVRTNCMDCLDRTNVVQSTLAKWMLTQQLREVGVLSNKEKIDEITSFMDLFRNVWADNADAVSLPYAGTGAQKTDFTRTKQGAISDIHNSITRYVLNNFKDGLRQVCVYEVKPNISPFIETKLHHIKFVPQILLGCIALLIFLNLIPKYDDYAHLIRFIMIINVFAIIFLVRFIFENGSEFVNWPRLVPRDYRYYRGPGAASHKVPRYTDSEYGEKIELQKIE